MKDLDLRILEDGRTTGLSVRNGGFLAEAASVCLDNHRHPIEIKFQVSGAFNRTYNLKRLEIDELSTNSFADLEEATQFGAMGVAVAIMHDQMGWKVKRSWKGTGFDYWVGNQEGNSLFDDKLRLEVSGDLEGTDSEVNRRLKEKMEQTKRSDDLKIPAYAIIVEFKTPKSSTGTR